MQHRFGPFLYDAGERQLVRDGDPISLNPKLIDTLHVLLENRGRVVSKADLMRLVWPDTTVEETGLARNISLLRKALGDEAEEFIETVPKRGYRFTAESANEPVQAPVSTPGLPVRRIVLGAFVLAVAAVVYWQFFLPGRFLPSDAGAPAQIAILPFEPLTAGVPAGFPKALQEVLVSEVTAVPARVLSPSTIDRYRQTAVPPQIMARVLGIEVILEGAIQSDGATLRISARLADVHTGKLIWAATYDRPAADPQRAQREIATAISVELSSRLRKP